MGDISLYRAVTSRDVNRLLEHLLSVSEDLRTHVRRSCRVVPIPKHGDPQLLVNSGTDARAGVH